MFNIFIKRVSADETNALYSLVYSNFLTIEVAAIFQSRHK